MAQIALTPLSTIVHLGRCWQLPTCPRVARLGPYFQQEEIRQSLRTLLSVALDLVDKSGQQRRTARRSFRQGESPLYTQSRR